MELRTSEQRTRITDVRWRSVIRVFAFGFALLGFILIAHEIFENITCRSTAECKIHLSEMIWGLVLLSLGLLIIQKGDVSTSLKEFTASGSIVREWFRRGRSTDAPDTVVKTTVVKPADPGNGGQADGES